MFRNLVDHPWVLVILVVLIIALFGSKRLPDAARGLGRSMRIFKSEVKEMKNDGKEETKTSPTAAAHGLRAHRPRSQARRRAGRRPTRPAAPDARLLSRRTA